MAVMQCNALHGRLPSACPLFTSHRHGKQGPVRNIKVMHESLNCAWTLSQPKIPSLCSHYAYDASRCQGPCLRTSRSRLGSDEAPWDTRALTTVIRGVVTIRLMQLASFGHCAASSFRPHQADTKWLPTPSLPNIESAHAII